ncbi:MAG: hypothetical protein KDD44_06110, partial [Bdellovibrionales bacterium]|nr:hypothetical protein [Bdellovibrionales bacterium]
VLGSLTPSCPWLSPEMGQNNVEISDTPHPITPTGWVEYEAFMRDALQTVTTAASDAGARILMTGLSFFAKPEDIDPDRVLSTYKPRYRDFWSAFRRLQRDDGSRTWAFQRHPWEAPVTVVDDVSIGALSLITSQQTNICVRNVSGGNSAWVYNLAQALCAPLVVIEANSGVFPAIGRDRKLHHVHTCSRPDIWKAAIAGRVDDAVRLGVGYLDEFTPRRAARAYTEMIEQSIARHPVFWQEPEGTGDLELLESYVSTIWHMVRLRAKKVPVGDGSFRRIVLVETRWACTQPTLADTLALTALELGVFYGCFHRGLHYWVLVPRWADANTNAREAINDGWNATFQWRDQKQVPATEVCRELLDLAAFGLREQGLDPTILEPMYDRLTRKTNGGAWTARALAYMNSRNVPADQQADILSEALYQQQCGNRPVAYWENPEDLLQV